ncbi:23S rRNA (uridine(2552)-2'-O)-methyltransferase [Deferribacterales bacterium]|nr:23S rRNA (uridine(2552)-2'-O)-methyltransferase [Deferribacterales bacterium]
MAHNPYKRKDSYYLKAKQEGYKSRAAYKLIELNQKYKLLKKGYSVLDCGAAPGGWTQVALSLVETTGCVVAVDYEVIEGISGDNFTFIQGDMLKAETITAVLQAANGSFNAVLSDMAPKTTGIKLKDHVGSIELATVALEIAKNTLKAGGSFLVKIFDGEDRPAYLKSLKTLFREVRTIRPDATRKESYEMYVVAIGKLPQV